MAQTNWYDAVYLSNDATFDNSDISLTSQYIDAQTPLAANSNYTIDKNITIPSTATLGDRYLLYVTDYDANAQVESNENNNVVAAAIEITHPDLRIADTTAPLNVASGETVPLSWTVNNDGKVTALNNWRDRVYLSSDTTIDNSDTRLIDEYIDAQTPLASGGNYTISKNLAIGNTRVGSYYLLFATDYRNDQNETNETNNLKTVPIEITVPDLVVTNATAPSNAKLGETVSLSWTVTNSGKSTASAHGVTTDSKGGEDKLFGSNTLLIKS